MSKTQNKSIPKTDEMWICSADLIKAFDNPFYDSFSKLLREMDFGKKVRAICDKHYNDGAGQPPIDPEVYFKMLFISFFNNTSSEREIERRCHDSITLRKFLGYSLTEKVPDHSTISGTRRRYSVETFEAVFQLVLPVLSTLGLIKGVHVGMDTSTMDANASMRNLQNRLSGEKYRKYVEKLAKAEGIDTSDPAEVSKFDRKRKKKVSNEEWVNPHDPDAKIGPTKRGNFRMIYKTEHVVDMETGAILNARVLPGDMADNANLTDRLIDSEMVAAEGLENGEMDLPLKSLTADKGCHDDIEIIKLHEYGIVANIPQRTKVRNYDKLKDSQRDILEMSDAFVSSKEGKELLKKRGMYIERSFAHVLDSGGMRRTTLRGEENIQKRYIIAAMSFNLSLAMGVRFGYGTPKQYGAGNKTDSFLLFLLVENKINAIIVFCSSYHTNL